MAWVDVEELLGAPVLLHGIQLGRPVDVILDRSLRRALGLEIHCGDDSRRFVPLSVVRFSVRGIELASPLVMLEERELAFYTQRGSTLRALRHADVDVRGRFAGSLVDIAIDREGLITEVIVLTASGLERLSYGPDVVVEPDRRSVRAAS